jgi:hypothetical protein
MRNAPFHAPPTRRSVVTASIILIALYAALMIGGALSTRNGVMPTGDPAGQDFSNFYAASRLVRDGRAADAYDLAAFNRAIVADHPGATATYFWAYPPPTGLLVAPLAYMPYGVAMTIWTLLGVLAFLSMAWRLFPSRLTILAAAASPALFWDVWHHQLGGITAALLAFGFYESARRPLAAGASIGLLVIKPHLAVAAPFLLAAGRRWKQIFAAGATVIGVSAVSYLIFGPTMWAVFLSAAGRAREILESPGQLKALMPSIFVALQLLGAPTWLCWTAQGSAAVAAIMVGIWVWRATSDSGMRTAAALAACALISPYTFAYDSTLTALAVAAYTGSAVRTPPRQALYGFLVLAWFLPLPAAALGTLYRIQIGWLAAVLVMVAVLAALPNAVERRSHLSEAAA